MEEELSERVRIDVDERRCEGLWLKIIVIYVRIIL
jgi:hypothetical protein